MSDDLTQELKFVADPSGIEAGVERGKRSIKSLGKAAEDVGREGGDSLGKVGKGAERSAKEIEQATRNMEANLQRQIAKFESAGQSARQYQESLARLRGADLAKLKPLLDQLDAAKAKSEAAARSTDVLTKSTNSLGTAASYARGHLVAMAGSITATAIVGFIKSVNDGVDALNDIRDATGSTIENISALEDVGRRTGASFETVGSILVKFNDVLSKATPKSDIANALKAIGLEAEALKKLDPAEALRVTAVALSNYADDANKARLVQDLFGKSVKEAAPFLADLAEKGELVAKVTQKQAEEADKFNKELFALEANSIDAARALTGPLIEGINATAKAFREGREAGKSFWEIAAGQYWKNVRAQYGMLGVDTGPSADASANAAAQAEKLQALQNKLVGVQLAADREPGNETAQRRLKSLQTQIESTKKAADEAARAVINLMAPPAEYTPPPAQDDKPTVKLGPTEAERARVEAAAKKAADAEKKRLEDLQKTWAELNGLSSSYYADLKRLQDQRASGELPEEQYAQAVEKLIQRQPFAIELQKKDAEAMKASAKAAQQLADARNDDYDAGEKFLEQQRDLASEVVKGIEERIAALALEDDAASLAAATNFSLAEALLRVRAARLQEKLDGPTGSYEGSEDYLRRKAEIDALNREADQIGRNDRNERVRDTTKRAQQEWERYVEDTSRGLGDAIETAIFDGSKAGGEKMREVLQEALLRKPLRMLIDGVMNQVTGGALNLLFGGGGGGGALGGAAGGGNPLGGLLSLGSSAYNAYSGLTSGTGVLGSIGSYFGLGSQTVSAGANINLLASGIPGAQAVGSGSLAAGGGLTTVGAGSWTAGGIAGLIAAVVINAFGGMRSESMIGSGLRGTLDGKRNLEPWEEWREGGGILFGPEFTTGNPLQMLEDYRKKIADYYAQPAELQNSPQSVETWERIVREMEKNTAGLSELVTRQSKAVNDGYNALRTNIVGMADSIGLAGSKVKDFAFVLDTQDLNFQGLKPEEIQAKIAKTLEKAGNTMAKELLGYFEPVTETITRQITENVGSSEGQDSMYVYRTETETETKMVYRASQYAKAGETVLETLTRLSTSFNTLNTTMDALGYGIQEGSLALADFASDFIEAFGGLEKFTATTSAYMQAYYSDEERRQALLRSGARQANALGLSGVTAESLEQLGNAGMRAFIDGITAGGASAKQIADAMDLAVFLAPAFQQAVEAQPEVASPGTSAADAAASRLKSLQDEQVQLQIEMAQAMGNTAEEIRLLTLEMNEVEKAAFMANRALRLEVNAQNAINDLRDDGRRLQADVLRAQGDETGASALEAALDREAFMAPFAELTGARKAEIATLYDANVATRAYVQSLKDAQQARVDALVAQRNDAQQSIAETTTATEAAWTAIEATFAKARQELESTRASLQQFVDTAKSGAQSMFGAVDDVARFQMVEGRAFIEEALATAQANGGKVPEGKDLADAIAAVERGFSASAGVSKAESDYQRLVVANQLKGLQEVGEDQLSDTEKQLKKLDQDLEQGRTMINELRGINTGAKDMATALANLVTAFNKESEARANAAAKGILSSRGGYFDYATGTGLTSSGVFFDADAIKQAAIDSGATGPQMFAAIKAAGFTIAEAEKMFGSAPGSLENEAKKYGVPIFHEGTDYVPRTGWALLQEGEAVIPAKHNPFPVGDLSGSGRLEALMARQTERMDAMVASVDKVAASTLRTAQILDSVKRGNALAMAEPTEF